MNVAEVAPVASAAGQGDMAMARRSGNPRGRPVRALLCSVSAAAVLGVAGAVAASFSCPWDCAAGGDGAIGLEDVLALLDQWGGPGECDVNGGGVVEVDDLLAILGYWGPCPTQPACGADGAGSCFEAHAAPGCDNADCCNRVCAIDPACCESDWDAACRDLALSMCGHCGDPGAGSCCQPDKTPGCDDPACCAAVCGSDPFCCEVEWDALCSNSATLLCGCNRPP